MDESTWLNDALKDEAGHSALWLLLGQVIWE
jgi:hypothetical protein